MMQTGRHVDTEEIGEIVERAEAIVPFLDWLRRQPASLVASVMECVKLIQAVIAGQAMVVVSGEDVPDYWAMAEAAMALVCYAEVACFPAAVEAFQITYEYASQQIEETMQRLTGVMQ